MCLVRSKNENDAWAGSQTSPVQRETKYCVSIAFHQCDYDLTEVKFSKSPATVLRKETEDWQQQNLPNQAAPANLQTRKTHRCLLCSCSHPANDG